MKKVAIVLLLCFLTNLFNGAVMAVPTGVGASADAVATSAHSHCDEAANSQSNSSPKSSKYFDANCCCTGVAAIHSGAPVPTLIDEGRAFALCVAAVPKSNVPHSIDKPPKVHA